MMADGVLDLGPLGLGAGSSGKVLAEILVKGGDGRHFDVDAPRFQVPVGDGPQLRRNALHTEALVAEVLAGQHVDLGQGLVVPRVVESLPGREQQVQVPGELLEGQNELEAQVFVIEDIKKGIVVAQIVEAVFLQQLHIALRRSKSILSRLTCSSFASAAPSAESMCGL